MSENNNTRICKVCHQEFPKTPEYFSKQPKCLDGLLPTCKTCMANKNGVVRKKFPAPDGMKRCTKCGKFYPATTEYFFAHRGSKASKDGLTSTCKDCSKARDYPNANKWYYDNKDKVTEDSKQYYQNNRESVLARVKRYAQENPDKIIAVQRNRRARELMADGTHTPEDIAALYRDQDGRCLYCGIPVFDSYHVDHIIPLTRNGSNWPDNLAITCPTCNCSKGDKLIHEWEVVRGW